MIWYIYPQWHKVSFSIIAEKHIRELRKYFRIYEIDEVAFPTLSPCTKPLLIIHPLFYPMVKYSKHVERLLTRIRGIIGIDVADSDRISNLAVSITNYCEAVIVPSTFAREAYVRSGVTRPVYVVPHGLDNEYFTKPKEVKHFKQLWELKKKKNLKYLLFFCWHSEYRKGLDLVLKTYHKLRKLRNDIVLILKLMGTNPQLHQLMNKLGGIIIHGWLTEEQKLELYDVCDIYLGFSRGGGFELNFLEALARGEIVIAAERGAWTDYLPRFCLVKCHNCPYVFKDNLIHVGRGVEVDVNAAVKKILHVVKHLDDYKAAVKEYVDKVISKKYTWEKVGKQLAHIIRKYL